MRHSRKCWNPLGRLLAAAFLAAGCGRPREVPPETIVFTAEDHELVADLYSPRRPNGIGVVLLHGSSPAGRTLHMYPEMCRALARRGYTLLNVDFRGYGDSENPRRPDDLADYDFVGDAVAALHTARELRPAIRAWVVAGHSKGGGVALHAAQRDGDVRAVISISPGRRIATRFFTPGNRSQLDYLHERKSRDMRLPERIPIELLEPILRGYDMGELAGRAFAMPVLLIEGGREPKADLAYSREWVASVSGDVTHEIIETADHYFGTAITEEDGVKAWRTTQPDVFNALVELMDGWLQTAVLQEAAP